MCSSIVFDDMRIHFLNDYLINSCLLTKSSVHTWYTLVLQQVFHHCVFQ